MANKVTLKTCEVGLFRLPGVVFEKGDLNQEQVDEIKVWIKENQCGTYMNNELYSFKNEGQRDWFILRWGELESSRTE